MRKIISALVMLAVSVLFATQASAAGAITSAEQEILNELNAGVSVKGKTFHLAVSDISAATNHLKANDVSSENAAIAVQNIRLARTLIEAQNIDAKSGSELKNKLPSDVLAKVMEYYATAANAVGLNASTNGKTVSMTDSKGNTVASAKGSVIKKTGMTFASSIILFTLLMSSAFVLAVLNRKATVKLA
ncbi:hypothetical protein ACFFIF_02255 [Vagococcus entomophilus]|uniref:Uncharacterized protein n=1 Tax=Vagococcus entomophilus TaxID=1160095 RepID=A0A430AK01_9ENTE|nr:hypothetical protein [Vagococcus entomophilus]RSU08379.1 hypothetical protein CBF30_03835 [Vagococcus entomophilus]